MIRTPATPRSADLSIGVLAVGLLAVAAALALTGAGGLPGAPEALLLKVGLASPLTGMTRSFIATIQGDLARAIYFHPLGPLCVLACLIAAANLAVITIRGERLALLDRLVRIRASWLAVAAVFVAVWARQILVFSPLFA